MPLAEPFREYVENVCGQIRWKKVRPAVAEELEAHLDDQRQALMEEGASEEDAVKETLRQMGDPVDVGGQLDRVHRPKPQRAMLAAVGLLLVMGFCFSLAANLLRGVEGNPVRVVNAYLLAAVLILCCYFLDFSFLGRIPVILNSTFLALWAVLYVLSIPFSFHNENYFWFGGFSLNLAYLSLLVPLFYALLIYHYRNRGYRGIGYCVLWFLPYLALMSLCPPYAGMVTAIVSCFLLLCMAVWQGWFGTERRKGMFFSLIPAILCAALGCLVIFSQEHNREQVLLLFNPELAREGAGYHYWVKRELLKNAHFIGHGDPVDFLETSMASTSTLSFDWDNFLTLFTYDFGWIVFLAVVAALAIFAVLAFRRVRKLTNALSRVVALAILFTLLGQIVFYLLETLGFGLISGLSLPLISPGNAALMVDAVLVGFLLSVFRNGEAMQTENLVKRATIFARFLKKES